MKKFFALFAAAALLIGMSACTNEDNPSSGQEDVVVAPAQLKQGIWTEYDEALLTSGKYTAEELAAMPTVGMWIQGDKGYFFTYTAEDMSETVEGQISYNNNTGKGTITFPAIQDSPLSGQTVNFSMASDDVMEFDYTYEGQKITGHCTWLCENLDNWSSDITDEDWKALMDYYQLIAADWGPDASIDWSDSEVEGLDEPLVWNETAKARVITRVDPMTVSIGMNVLFSLFMTDPCEEVNAKLDAITEKLDQVLANQQKMMMQLDQVNNRLIAIAQKLNQQETVTIFNNRNEKYYNPLKVLNTNYFDDAYQLYVENKSDLSKVSATLGKYAKKWVGDNEENVKLTWQYMEYLTTVQHTTYGTGMDRIYDGLTYEKYPWEHMGTGDRMNYRAYDMSIITKCLFMISLYSTYCDLDDIDKKALYNNYKTYKPKLNEFCSFKVANPDEFLVCQIPGAHFVMHKQLQKYNYCGKDDKTPDCRDWDAVYRPEWHEAGSFKIDNPKEVKEKLIRISEAVAIQKYYGSLSWYDILVDGNKMSAGAVYSKKPSGVRNNQPCLLLYNSENPQSNGLFETGFTGIDIRFVWVRSSAGEQVSMGNTREMFSSLIGVRHWLDYNSKNEYYTAIVEQHY